MSQSLFYICGLLGIIVAAALGYYFEHFYLRPQNLVYRVLPLGSNQITAPLCSPNELRIW